MDLSELKHLPTTDYAPAEMDEASKLLLRAADLIERQGWCQNRLGSAAGAVCINGALLLASGYPASEDYFDATIQTALDRIRAVVRRPAFAWNDSRGRTQAEVVAKLRAVALGG